MVICTDNLVFNSLSLTPMFGHWDRSLELVLVPGEHSTYLILVGGLQVGGGGVDPIAERSQNLQSGWWWKIQTLKPTKDYTSFVYC